jgi:hypothetical protein
MSSQDAICPVYTNLRRSVAGGASVDYLVEPVPEGGEEGVHALERRLPDLEPVV